MAVSNRAVLAVLAASVLVVGGCDAGGGGSSSGGGQSCSQQQHDDGIYVCSGTRVVTCEAATEELPSATGFVWTTLQDCSTDGRVCSNGACEEPPTQTGNCPDMSGTWVFTQHCEPSVLGMGYDVSQSGCDYTVSDPWNGWSGTIGANGEVTANGPAGDDYQTCSGQLSGGTISVTCQPGSCYVELQRP